MTAVPLADVVSLRATAYEAHLRVFTTDDTAALDLAAADWDPDSGVMPGIAQAAAFPFGDDDQGWDAWCEYARAVRERNAIDGGTEHWLCFFDDLSYDEAREKSFRVADEARCRFLTGPRR